MSGVHNLTTVASYGRKGSSARVRIYEWLDFLGLDARKYTYTDQGDNSIATLARNVDKALGAETALRRLAMKTIPGVLLMSREASPLSNGRLEAKLLQRAETSVYDFDDAIFHSAAPFPYSLWPKDKVWRRSVEAADRIIAGNDYLAEEASKFSRNVTMIPSCVNPDLYPKKTDYSLNEVPTLVWLGSPATEQFLPPIADALLRVNRVRPIRLRVISAGERSLGPLDAIVDRVQWSESGFAQELHNADLGIMPLADDPFARGKCAYKLLQYGAAALPALGSPVGTNRSVLAAMGAEAPSTADEWEASIHDMLAAGDAERAALGDRAYKTVTEQFSFQAWRSEWLQVIGG
ncbi:hypothetical protein [Arthrobacter sp. zg-Y750]|uniref:hypothetical protein n=1 Tax=Arthrobacter sp. zg-Y750 TaxID=2894189 RepID=UPI001E625D59|nr:hypothetical protein [Arthrobacter sp. zg-Y750]MCC9176122.1 hypothetical protein [Arthrobacter sp. zg-Y750]